MTIRTIIIGIANNEAAELDDTDTLHSLTRAIDARWIDHVGLSEGIDLWCDDEGAINHSDLNVAATIVAHVLGTPAVLFGRVAVTSSGPDGDTIGLSDEQLTRINGILTTKPSRDVLDQLATNLQPHPVAALIGALR